MYPNTWGAQNRSVPWLERLAGLWPHRMAVVDPDTGVRYTYDELDRRSRSIARGLQHRGVCRGERVAALMHNGVPVLDLVFACGRLGAIFVPINWRLSRREVAEILADAAPRLIVAASEFTDLLPPSRSTVQLILLEGTDTNSFQELLSSEEQISAETVGMNEPWMLLYTGGTTGMPKGAILTHGSVTWNAINTIVSWGLAESDSAPNFTPMFHTSGLNVLTLPLLMLGGRIILPKRFDPAQALNILERERPTLLFMVPSMYALVAEQPHFSNADLSSLRWAISGGAPLPDRIYERWKDKVRIFKQGYGLTEVGPNNFATPDEAALRKRGTVGRLTYFAHARIVDDEGRDVATNMPGELLLAGPHMCAGYWQRPEATAAAIHDSWFHTGDIARRDEEGYYYIVDRKKDMIITGGENVYPSEIEAILYDHPAIREAAVVGIPHEVWGEAVCAVVSLRTGASLGPNELQQFVRARLAGYKVPKQVIIVDELPKSATGKILRIEARKLATAQTQR
jgi:fatty-acyl-CoA synthase